MLSNEARPGVVSSDVEKLAKDLMGWTWDGTDGWRNEKGFYVELVGAFDLNGEEITVRHPWNPFTDANADVRVLELARGKWMSFYEGNRSDTWTGFFSALPRAEYYKVGDYARAALAVLEATC